MAVLAAGRRDYPGWRFYAAGVFNDRNPWWIAMPDVSRYLQRLSFLMRQGTPVVDVAVLLPVDDAWAAFAPGNVHLIELLKARVGPDVIPAILDAGFNLDFVDPMTLARDTTDRWPRLRVGAQRYSAVVLPYVERTTADTLRLLERFARVGGRGRGGTKPSLPPGFAASAVDRERFRQRRYGCSKAALRGERSWRNRHGSATRYSVNKELRGAPAFGADRRDHPASSRNGRSVLRGKYGERRAGHRTGVETTHGSCRVVGSGDRRDDAVDVTRPSDRERMVSIALGALHVRRDRVLRRLPARRRRRAFAVRCRAPIDLSTGWTLMFPGAAPMALDRLQSWTDSASRREFSGVATYAREVTLSAADLQDHHKIAIDLGAGKRDHADARSRTACACGSMRPSGTPRSST